MPKIKKIYGRICLTQAQIDLIVSALHSNLAMVRSKESSAESADERAFYTRIASQWPDADTARFLRLSPGKIPFSEAELEKLRGSIASARQPLLEAAWNEPDQAKRNELFMKINPLNELSGLLAEPFRADRSGDAEEEDDAEEGDIT